jgi:hypothetical protein
VKAGKLRALAVTTAQRSALLPDLPTVGEFVPGYEASDWFGVGAPKKTAPAIIDRLNKEVAGALADPQLIARIEKLGGAPLVLTPAAFGKMLADETEKWGKVIGPLISSRDRRSWSVERRRLIDSRNATWATAFAIAHATLALRADHWLLSPVHVSWNWTVPFDRYCFTRQFPDDVVVVVACTDVSAVPLVAAPAPEARELKPPPSPPPPPFPRSRPCPRCRSLPRLASWRSLPRPWWLPS